MKRVVIILILGCVAIGLIVELDHLLTTGHITITSDHPSDTITLTQVMDDSGNGAGGKVFSKQAKGRLSLTLGVGNYTATIQGNSIAATQTITLKPFQNLHYNLSPINTTGVEPVIYKNASDISASSSHLFYLDSTDETLHQVDSQNVITQLHPDQRFKSIQWADDSYGVGQGSDGKLYSITSGSVSALTIPIPTTPDKTMFYSVAPNRELFVAEGGVVYSGGPGRSFKKIYADKDPFTSLLATDGKVAVINTPGDGSFNASSPYIVVVNDSGKSFKKNVTVEGSAVWSPNGQRLASIKDPGAGLTIYDSSLRTIATIPGSATNGLVWIDDNSITYGDQGLWTYSITSGRANLIANMPLGAGVTGVALSSDKAYIYVSTVDNDSNTTIKRIGLRDQKIPIYVYNLQSILPLSNNEYTLSLINFTHPTVLVQPNPTAPPSYLHDAETDLQQRGFDLGQLQIQISPPPNLNESQ